MSLYPTAGLKLFIGSALAQKSTDFIAADFSSQAWTEVAGLENLGNLGDSAQSVTIDLIGEGRTKTLKGTRSAGSMEVVCGMDALDAGQIAAIAAEKTPHDYAFKMEMNDAPPIKSGASTITIASPGVVSWTAHGRSIGDAVKFATTGALPTGLVAGTSYYVIAAGLTTDAFQLATTPGGTAIVTTGTQSGVHTASSVPANGTRLFIAKVMSANEAFDGANNVRKQNFTLGVNSNVVRVAATAA